VPSRCKRNDAENTPEGFGSEHRWRVPGTALHRTRSSPGPKDDELLMQLQLNVHRLVVVYRVPALDALDAATFAVRLERWRLGAEHAGWKFGWRDTPIAGDSVRRYVETYCYAFAGTDFHRR
jgi:hypothetical protein